MLLPALLFSSHSAKEAGPENKPVSIYSVFIKNFSRKRVMKMKTMKTKMKTNVKQPNIRKLIPFLSA